MRFSLSLLILSVMGILAANCSNRVSGDDSSQSADGSEILNFVSFTYTHHHGSMYFSTPEYKGSTDLDLSLAQNKKGEWALVRKHFMDIDDEMHYVTDSIIVNDSVPQKVLAIADEFKLYEVVTPIEKDPKVLAYDAGSWYSTFNTDSLNIDISFGDVDSPKRKSDRDYLSCISKIKNYLLSLLPE